ncbi:MAG: UbiH/UbiF/VisC/COQ6 family ubiquinone biosynthesis hydroxylase, partial [Alphaproteobacteria bacterium]
IVGAGMVGLTLGCALAGAGLRVAVIDRTDPDALASDHFDGRATSIALGGRRVLGGIGVWRDLEAYACPIDDIRVSDADSRLFLHYDHVEVGDEPLGYMAENRHIRRALTDRATSLDCLWLRAPARLEAVHRSPDEARLQLDDGTTVTAEVVLACDGKGSGLRRAAGIPATEWRYRQTGIVCTVVHERPHRNVAHERFLPAGPFAILPLVDDEAGRHRSSLVWTEREAVAPAMLALDDRQFTDEVARRFGDFLGAVGVTGPRWSYPLSLYHAGRYVGRRLALVGDAAHAIHPIAGQGFNLGLRDIAALAEILVDTRRLGLDIGSAEVLRRYERWRRFDNTVLMFVTDGLNRLFSNDIAPLRLARDAGLAVVNELPPLKRYFMRHAMGLVGKLPRLVEGRSL